VCSGRTVILETRDRNAMGSMRTTSLPAFMVAAGILAVCAACKPKGDERRILALIERAAILAEGHKTGKIMDLATKTFVADPGGRDRKEVQSILAYAFLRYGNFRIKFPTPAIEIAPSGDAADVRVPFVVFRENMIMPDLTGLRDNPGKWIEEVAKSADPYHLELKLEKIDGEWMAERAHIEGLRGPEEL
jgi:hypothetical protein